MTLLQPSVGLPDFWAGSGFEDKLLQAQGDFSLNAGQHSVTYLPNDEMIAADCPCPLREWQPYGLMSETYSCRQPAGGVPPDIGGSRYVSRSVKQLSVGLTWVAVLFR